MSLKQLVFYEFGRATWCVIPAHVVGDQPSECTFSMPFNFFALTGKHGPCNFDKTQRKASVVKQMVACLLNFT